METFHLYHLAACWGGKSLASAPPLTIGLVKPIISHPSSPSVTAPTPQIVLQDTVIRAAAAQMIFASRTSQAFITPEQVSDLERWTGMVGPLLCPTVCDRVRNNMTELMAGCARSANQHGNSTRCKLLASSTSFSFNTSD
jgi:hypothetical protein